MNDPRIRFAIPDGPDCLYQVFNHRYLLTHGDQFRGGDGLIGCLGPIVVVLQAQRRAHHRSHAGVLGLGVKHAA